MAASQLQAQGSASFRDVVISNRVQIPVKDTTGSAYCGEIRLRRVSGDTALYIFNCRTTGRRWERFYSGVTILDNRGNLDTVAVYVNADTIGLKSIQVIASPGGNLGVSSTITDSTIRYSIFLPAKIYTTPSNDFDVDGTEYSGDFKATQVDSFSIDANSIILRGAVAFGSYQDITSGTTTTIGNNINTVTVNPGSTLASHTITLPAAPKNGQEVKIEFGGTLTSGTVVTTLSIAANTGQALIQPSAPTTAVAGDCLIYHYKTANAKWYRVK